jgi:hypothetical protein
MNKYQIIKSTGGSFSGLAFECESKDFTQEKLEEVLNVKFKFLKVLELNGLFVLQNEHITLYIQEVNK